MNAWTLFAVVMGIIHLAGLVMLVGCALWAPEGYEDTDGFRLGCEPAPGRERREIRVSTESRDGTLSDALKQATWQTSAPF